MFNRPKGLRIPQARSASVGAQGRDRTTDTAIFSRMLYQLSYLGTSGSQEFSLGAGSAGL